MVYETRRLLIRPFASDDLRAIHRILDQAFGDGRLADDPAALGERAGWLAWSALSQEWLPKLHQPPYGDQAIALKSSGEVVGAVGYVPLLMPFEQLAELGGVPAGSAQATPEVGLFWAVDPAHQRQGYAIEAAQALVEHAFREWRLKRILATTDHDNLASQGVMRKLGMTLARNPQPEPPWMQVVGILVTAQLSSRGM